MSTTSINAHNDRIQAAATYREPVKKRRCLVPASAIGERQMLAVQT